LAVSVFALAFGATAFILETGGGSIGDGKTFQSGFVESFAQGDVTIPGRAQSNYWKEFGGWTVPWTRTESIDWQSRSSGGRKGKRTTTLNLINGSDFQELAVAFTGRTAKMTLAAEVGQFWKLDTEYLSGYATGGDPNVPAYFDFTTGDTLLQTTVVTTDGKEVPFFWQLCNGGCKGTCATSPALTYDNGTATGVPDQIFIAWEFKTFNNAASIQFDTVDCVAFRTEVVENIAADMVVSFVGSNGFVCPTNQCSDGLGSPLGGGQCVPCPAGCTKDAGDPANGPGTCDQCVCPEVCGVQFIDPSETGVFSKGDVGLEGNTVTVSYDGKVVETLTTGADGSYSFFAKHGDGQYTIEDSTPSAPVGVVRTFPSNGVRLLPSITAGENYCFNPAVPLDFGWIERRSICGTLWVDANADTAIDGDETIRFDKHTVKLMDMATMDVFSETTDVDGK